MDVFTTSCVPICLDRERDKKKIFFYFAKQEKKNVKKRFLARRKRIFCGSKPFLGREGVSMPAKFDRCVSRGGRVRTIKPRGQGSKVYLHVCYPVGGGSPVSGEVKKRKTKATKTKKQAARKKRAAKKKKNRAKKK